MSTNLSNQTHASRHIQSHRCDNTTYFEFPTIKHKVNDLQHFLDTFFIINLNVNKSKIDIHHNFQKCHDSGS